jgi:subtilase family serine protease
MPFPALILVAALGAPHCSTAAPRITSAVVRSVERVGDLNQITIAVSVTNAGPAQGGDVLQAVDVLQNGVKLDQKSVPPLRAGRSATVTYVFQRAVTAATGTTELTFRLEAANNVSEDCTAYTISA